MSTTVHAVQSPALAPARSRRTAADRMKALARAELTLLGRNKSTLFTVLVLPGLLTASMYGTVGSIDLKKTGLNAGTVLLPGSLGFALLFALYSPLVGIYVVRREELVLKRLRTGELRDREILAGAALPAVLIALAQSVLLVAGCSLWLHVPLPASGWLAALALLLGIGMICALAAATSAVTRTAEGAQITVMPLMLLSTAGSGMVVPLDVLPDKLAAVCEALPLTPLIQLVRGAWTGGAGAGEVLRELLVMVVWTFIAVLVVRKRFRWEPRR
ncbi:ABC transporter permease [Streptomyces sp. NBC_00083]|uniref:ABC transporter permease n=1 Tax=Streptomyces sp. NBC_00083 TaxID=2975647 RepID=UPI0022502202|nr:ABC transporter permease [Streptomyces sp. NBC_00083]MCX5387716.1 ABC transporter permease [Streptomyces sp. NBC_00083]